MKLTDAKTRREAIIKRELDINAQLSEMKRAYIVDKVPGDFGLRTTLEAELSTLAVEKHSLTQSLGEAKTAMKVYRGTLAHAQLIRLVMEQGLGALVIEADRLACEAAGVEVSA